MEGVSSDGRRLYSAYHVHSPSLTDRPGRDRKQRPNLVIFLCFIATVSGSHVARSDATGSRRDIFQAGHTEARKTITRQVPPTSARWNAVGVSGIESTP